jgi:hypothetical protein
MLDMGSLEFQDGLVVFVFLDNGSVIQAGTANANGFG